MSRVGAWTMAVAAALLLGGCASAPVRAPVAVDPVLAAQAEADRAAIQAWGLAGRVAVSGGRQGGSGRLDWSQRGDRFELTLSAPVTRQGWRLVGDGGWARLEGVEGGPREGPDAGALLRQATGWDIPVRALVDWVRGVAAPEPMHGPARVVHGDGNLPERLDQAGWAIEYRDWFEAGPGQPALPRRIQASHGDARVRLVVDGWTLPPGSPEPEPEHDPVAQLERELAQLRLADPAADMRKRAAAGDLRPLAVCGYACIAPDWEAGDGGGSQPAPMRILDGTGDVVSGDRHLALKRQAHAYAAAYNRALAAWLRAGPPAGVDGR